MTGVSVLPFSHTSIHTRHQGDQQRNLGMHLLEEAAHRVCDKLLDNDIFQWPETRAFLYLAIGCMPRRSSREHRVGSIYLINMRS